jgi:hypothetical protein
MKAWNEGYRWEAEAIAAAVVGERGYRWKASEIERGRRRKSEEVEIAMRALMVARGEIDLPQTHYSALR